MLVTSSLLSSTFLFSVFVARAVASVPAVVQAFVGVVASAVPPILYAVVRIGLVAAAVAALAAAVVAVVRLCLFFFSVALLAAAVDQDTLVAVVASAVQPVLQPQMH